MTTINSKKNFTNALLDIVKSLISPLRGVGALLFLLLVACQPENWTYDGPQFYEFSASQNQQQALRNLIQKTADKKGIDSICVQLIKPTDVNVLVNYEIVDKVFYLKDKDKYVDVVPEGTNMSLVDTLTSTAVLGVDYTIEANAANNEEFSATDKKGSFVISNGKYFGYITLNVLKKDKKSFFVVLRDSPDAKANKPTSILQCLLVPESITFFSETFSTSIPDTWTLIDKDGDGYGWEYYKRGVTSDSWISGIGAVTPENYLISPLIKIGDTDNASLTFDLVAGGCVEDADYMETYKVIISETPITLGNCAQAHAVRDWTTLTTAHADDYQLENIDLTAYRNKSVYIGFVHGNCSGMYYIKLRNVKISGE